MSYTFDTRSTKLKITSGLKAIINQLIRFRDWLLIGREPFQNGRQCKEHQCDLQQPQRRETFPQRLVLG